MKYQIGDIVQGSVSDVKPYAIFMKFDDGICGLLHISELGNGFIKDIEKFASKGDEIKVKIISIDEKNGFMRVSLKQVPKEEQYSTHKNSRRKKFECEDDDFLPLQNNLDTWINNTLEEANKEKNK
ncbi:MAG: S1 RNA-binding domain-containing protein [Bacilli bacterium]